MSGLYRPNEDSVAREACTEHAACPCHVRSLVISADVYEVHLISTVNEICLCDTPATWSIYENQNVLSI